MNHRWNEPKEIDGKKVWTCKNCGVSRRVHTYKILMAIVNHPPWEAYKYETAFIYWNKGETPGTAMIKRPNCKK